MIVYFNGVSLGLLFSVLFSHPEMAMDLLPSLLGPFMLFAGFFSNQDNVPYYFYPIQYLSLFKYGFQASVMVDKKIFYFLISHASLILFLICLYLFIILSLNVILE